MMRCLLWIVTTLALIATPSMAQEKAGQSGPSFFKHPQKAFVLMLPKGAKAVTGGQHDVSIRSNMGYLMTLQTKERRADTTFEGMMSRLEAAYLGPGKVWSHKIDAAQGVVAGLPALFTTYEGARTRVRVVLARGPKTDMVFMFYAPTDAFEKLLPEFDWVLAQFDPGPRDRIAHSAAASPASALGAGWKTFGGGTVGYTISYPAEWVVERLNPTTVLMGGAANTVEFHVNVSVQNVPAEAGRDVSAAVQAVTDDLHRQFQSVGAQIIHQNDYDHANGGAAKGYQLSVAYNEGGQSFKQFTAIVPRADGVVHVWSYRAPDALFDRFKQRALTMLRKWRIQR